MPTILRVERARLFFYSSDRGEPMHVHAELGDGTAKFWLDPVRFAASRGLARHEGGEGIHWPELDEDLSVEGILAGRPSGESAPSLKKWLASRASRARPRLPSTKANGRGSATRR